ncbi:MAG: 1-acyl-sn-glycerol-3-phosphate acyltransferase [Roseburia sp.]
MQEKKVIYYQDELNDEFSEAVITPRVIDQNYVYLHKNKIWNLCSYLVQNVLSMPIKVLYAKGKFHIRYVGKEKLKKYKKEGYFLYVNHTQPFADTFLPSLPIYPKRNFFIVNPENVSMKGLQTLVEMLGAIPIPTDLGGMKHFLKAIEQRIKEGYTITIYPEAHIWPYYTKIRSFKDVSFKYPVRMKKPAFCMTNTYQAYGKKKDKVKIVSYIDGPFWPDETLPPKERQKELRDRIYACMCEKSENSNIEVIEYRKKPLFS